MDGYARERGDDGSDVSTVDRGLDGKRSIVMIPPRYVDEVWPLVAPMIEAAASHSRGQYTATGVHAEIMADERQLWIATSGRGVDATLCTKITEHPGKRSLYVSMAAGDISGIREMWPHIREFGKSWGCSLVVTMGRRGWARSGVFPPEFRHTADVWVAEI